MSSATMAAAAIQSILPSGMQAQLESKVPRPSPLTNSEEKDREKRFAANFDAKKRRRSPDETVESSRSQRLGESSPQLQLKDFELLKTIGTGMGYSAWGSISIGLTKISKGHLLVFGCLDYQIPFVRRIGVEYLP